MLDLTHQFAGQLYSLSQAPLTVESIHQCKRLLLDYLGVTVAGASSARERTGKIVDEIGDGCDATVIGTAQRSNPLTAALLNGIHAHVLELDDGIRFGSVHPGAPVFSALLPFAEKNDWSWDQLFRGVVTGYECASRLAGAIQPDHRNRGYHATGTVGSVAAAVAIAAAAGYSLEQMKNAFGTAVINASGMLKAIEGSSDLKPYNAGQAALSGVSAATMARAGFKAPDEVLTGERGFLTMCAGEVRIGRLLQNDDGPLGIEQVYIKPYAACRHAHAPIEAALRIRDQGLDPDDIDSIRISTYSLAVTGHDHTKIVGVGSAKMSTPYSVAVAFIDGSAGLAQFSESRVRDENVLRLARKVTVSLDPALDSFVPQKRPAVVEVVTRNGSVLKERVDLPKGEPETALTDLELEKKFEGLILSTGCDVERAERVSSIIQLGESDYSPLWSFL